MLHDYELISRWVDLFRNGKPISKFNFLDRLYIYYSKRHANVDAVISPSKFTMNSHEKLGFFRNSKKYVIPNAMRFKTNSNPKNNPTKEFLFVGQINYSKGPQIAINAFKKISEKTAKLHIVGRGPYLNTLKKLGGDDKRIIIHEYVEDEELESLFKQCSYFLFPSIWYENCPLVVNEAMNHGLPVIASNLGGVPELVINDYNGFLVEVMDINSLHKIMETIINDEKTLFRLSKNAIESSKKFSLEIQMENVLSVLQKTLT